MHSIWISFFCMWKVKELVSQSFPFLCNSMDCSPPGSSVHKIFQARILEWVAIPFSKGSSWPLELRYPTLQSESLLSEPRFKFLKSFQIIFFQCRETGVHFHLFECRKSFFQHYLLKRLSFPYWLVSTPSLKIIWPYKWGFISRLCSIGLCVLFLCQYYIILITIVLKFSLK